MIWLYIALLAPLIWALNNMFDQILMRGHFTGNALSLLATGNLLHIIPAAGMFLYMGGAGDIEPKLAFMAVALSVINGFAFWPYMSALEKSEGSNIVPFFQVIPVMVFILSWMFLGETLSLLQLLGAGCIIAAAFAIMIDWKNFHVAWRALGLLMASATVLSLTTFGYRFGLEQGPFLPVLAWSSLGYALFGAINLVFRPAARDTLGALLRTGKRHLLGFVCAQESLYYVSNTLFLFALSLAPSAGLVSTIGGFQPAFVLILSYLGYRLFPAFFDIPKSGRALAWHISCLVLMMIGLYLIHEAG